jgi:Lsr2
MAAPGLADACPRASEVRVPAGADRLGVLEPVVSGTGIPRTDYAIWSAHYIDPYFRAPGGAPGWISQLDSFRAGYDERNTNAYHPWKVNMAQRVEISLVDDIDGGQADETVAFGYQGAAYEIDLSDANAAKLRKVLGPYVEKARKSAGGAQVRRRRPRSGSSREHSAQVRAWAKQRGYKVNERGRIPANIMAEYEQATA